MGFFGPYLGIVASLGLWIAQFHSGLELLRPDFGRYYLLAIVVLLFTVIVAGIGCFLVSRKRLFPVFIALIIVPGLIGLIFSDFKNILVDADQNITLGAVNDPGGYISFGAALSISCLFGWGQSLIIIRIVRNADWARHLYDHIWFFAVLAGMLFVVQEVRVRGENKDFAQTMQMYRMATTELVSQLSDVRKVCAAAGELSPPRYLEGYTPSQQFCEWAQYHLSQYRSLSVSIDINFAAMQAETYSDALSKAGPLYWDRKITPESWNAHIEHEIERYNDHFCARNLAVVECKFLPLPLNGIPPEEIDNLTQKAALALRPLSLKLQELGQKANALRGPVWDHQSRHLVRMLFSVVLSFLIGGKVALATTGMIGYRPSDSEPKGYKRNKYPCPYFVRMAVRKIRCFFRSCLM